MRRLFGTVLLVLLSLSGCFAAVEDCFCFVNQVEAPYFDDNTGAFRTKLLFEGSAVRLTNLGHTEHLYLLNSCPGEEGGYDAIHEVLYRSGNGGEDWICMNTRMEGSDVIHTRFGARSSGITQIFSNPWDETRVVAVGPGPSYWTIIDEGGVEPWVSPEATPGFQIEFAYMDVVFNQYDNEKLLLSSMDEEFFPRWFTSRDFGGSTNVMGTNEHRLFSCQFGSGDSVVCDCVVIESSTNVSSYPCLSTDFGYTTTILPVEDQAAENALVGGIWHFDAHHSVLYAFTRDTGLVFFSVWDGETYPPLQRARIDGHDRLPGLSPSLRIVDSHSVPGEFAFLAASDLDSPEPSVYEAVLMRVAASSPGVLTEIRNTISMATHLWNTDTFVSYAADSDQKLSNQTLMLSSQTDGSGTWVLTYSVDYGRSWEEVDPGASGLVSVGIPNLLGEYQAASVPISEIEPMWHAGSVLYAYLSNSLTSGTSGSLFLSRDFGYTWEGLVSIDARYSYEIGMPSLTGDVIISQCTNVSVTRDLGLTWTTLFENDPAMYSFFIPLPPTEDGEYERFCAFSTAHNSVDCIYIPVSRPCQGMLSPDSEDSDFELYQMANGACIGGEQIVGVRKRREAECSMIGIDLEERVTSMPCQCTLRDFVCNAPEYVEEGYQCIALSGGWADPDGYTRSPYNVCEGMDDIYVHGDQVSGMASSLQAGSMVSSGEDAVAIDSDPEEWQWMLVASIGGVLFCFGVSMCLLSGVVLLVRAKQRNSEANVYGISSRELQLIDDELEGIDVNGYDDLDF